MKDRYAQTKHTDGPIFSFMLTMIAWKQHNAKLTVVSRAPTGNRTRIIPIPRERNSHYTISADKMETNAFKTLLHHWPDDNWTHCFHECGWRDSNPRFRHGEAAILTRLIHIRILESWCHMRALAWNAIHDYIGWTDGIRTRSQSPVPEPQSGATNQIRLCPHGWAWTQHDYNAFISSQN